MSGDASEDRAQEIRRFEDRLRIISNVTRRFAETTTDYELLLASVARSLTDALTDMCAVFLVSRDGSALNAVAMHASDPEILTELEATFATSPLLLAEQHAVRRVLETGEPLLVPKIDWTLPRTDTTAEQSEWQRRIGLHSFLLVALRLRGRSLGLLALGRCHPDSPAFEPHDQELSRNLADHASLAIENASLYAAQQQARRDAERAEERIRRSEATHRQFFESLPIGIFVIDATSLRILAANGAASRLYGYSAEEFLELSLKDLRHPNPEPGWTGIIDVTDARDTRGSATHVRKDGSTLFVTGGSHLSTFEGAPARFVFVVDQTERIRAELERDETAWRLQRTLDDMTEGYTIMGRDLRYLYVNEAGAQHTHLTKEQLLGHTPMELYPGFEGTKIHEALARVARGGIRERIEEEFVHADGETGYFELTIQPIPEGIVVLSVDATERRRAELRRDSLEEQLRQSQKMEAVGRLAGGIAHDFNNLLSVILGYGAELLGRAELPGALRADVEEIQKAGLRAAELTRQLLLFSRQQVFDPKILDLNEVIRSMDRMLRRVLGEQLELSLSLDRGLGPICADRSHLEQVIMNLTVNARDAMPNGGRLAVGTANVVIDDDFVRQHAGISPGQYVRMVISDTGIGIDRPTLARIFEPFFSTKEQGKGTGLGLSTVFGIVKQTGGGIWVESEVGRGTTFEVYLPRCGATAEAGASSPAPPEIRGRETVLLVEDEEQVRAVARRILERHGYCVLVARSPENAIELCANHEGHIHLLLSDVVMPRVNGVELACRLRVSRPAMKVLFVSGYSDGDILSRERVGPDAAFLQKPFTPELLVRKVRSILDGA